MFIFLSLVAFFILLFFVFTIGEELNLENWKIALIIILALFVGAPVGGLIVIFFGSALTALNIVELSLESSLRWWIFGFPSGALVGVIIVVFLCYRHFKKAQESEHNQYDKLKNDDKPKNRS